MSPFLNSQRRVFFATADSRPPPEQKPFSLKTTREEWSRKKESQNQLSFLFVSLVIHPPPHTHPSPPEIGAESILHRRRLFRHRCASFHRPGGLRCVSACGRRLAEDDLHHVVPGDVELVQAQPVSQRPAGEEPALGGGGHALLSVQAALHHAHRVGGADRQPEVTARGEAQPELALPPRGGVAGGVRVGAVGLVGALFDHVDGGREAVDRQLVAIPQFVVAFGQSSWWGERKSGSKVRGMFYLPPKLILIACHVRYLLGIHSLL